MAAPNRTDGIRLARLAGLSWGHASVDFCQGSVVILVPIVQASLGISIGAAALLIAVSAVTSSILQPAFGVVSDRHDLRWLIPGGVACAAIGMVVAGVAPTYPLAIMGVFVSGLGIAMFHPEAATWAGVSSGTRRATGMSYYSVGGNLGFALGPIVVAPLAVAFGRSALLWLLLPMGLTVAALTAEVVGFKESRSNISLRFWPSLRLATTPNMLLLVGVISIRSALFLGLAALVPLYLHLERGLSLTAAATVTSAYLVAGALGTLAGGPLADRFGRRVPLIASMMLMPPFGLAFVFLAGWPSYAALILMGGVIISTFSVTVTIAQELMPSNQGMASGISFGFAFGVGGLVAGVVGHLADSIGLGETLTILVLVPLLAVAMAVRLPETRLRTRPGARATGDSVSKLR